MHAYARARICNRAGPPAVRSAFNRPSFIFRFRFRRRFPSLPSLPLPLTPPSVRLPAQAQASVLCMLHVRSVRHKRRLRRRGPGCRSVFAPEKPRRIRRPELPDEKSRGIIVKNEKWRMSETADRSRGSVLRCSSFFPFPLAPSRISKTRGTRNSKRKLHDGARGEGNFGSSITSRYFELASEKKESPESFAPSFIPGMRREEFR